MAEGVYFEDCRVGRTFASPGCTVTESAIVDFALTYDPQPFHLDLEAAAASPYGGLIASGFHTLALTFRLFTQTGALATAGLGGSGVDELRWHVPVRPGDTLRVVAEVLEQRPSRSKPDRGTVRFRLDTFNQRGQLVQSCVCNGILARRDPTVAV